MLFFFAFDLQVPRTVLAALKDVNVEKENDLRRSFDSFLNDDQEVIVVHQIHEVVPESFYYFCFAFNFSAF